MKHSQQVAVAITLITIGSFITPAKCIFEDAILEIIEEFRLRMCHAIPKFSLPALDPLHVTDVQIEMDNKYLIGFTGSVTNLRLTGLSDFIINDFKISTIPLRKSIFDVTFPHTALKSIYTAKGSLAYIVNLAGDGNADAYVDNFRLTISWVLKTGSSLGIRNLKIKFKIGEIFIDFENLAEDERINDFIHALVKELGIELLDDVWQEEGETVENLIEKEINNFLGHYTLAEIIKIITGAGGKPIFGPEDPLPDCKDFMKYNKNGNNTTLRL